MSLNLKQIRFFVWDRSYLKKGLELIQDLRQVLNVVFNLNSVDSMVL